MVVIRLARQGRNKYPVYRIVAADKRRAATSKFLAVLGHYNPHTKEIKLDKELIATYLGNGAQPSDRVLRLFKANGIETPDWAKTHDRFKKTKKEAEKSEAKEGEVVVAEGTDKADQSVDGPETAATEEKAAKEEQKATEAVADAAVETAEAEAKADDTKTK